MLVAYLTTFDRSYLLRIGTEVFLRTIVLK